MQASEAVKEITDLNLSYLLLAQKLLKADRHAAMLRLGISGEMADVLVAMSLAEVIRIATSNFVLCAFRLDEMPGFQNMLRADRSSALRQAHLSIVLAGARNQAAALAA